jgi:hypothetical protein
MILASHGLIASQIASFDADAVAFFGRVTTAGGSLSATEKAAVNTLVVDMKAAGIWSAMKAIYPMVGASAEACKQNLKSSSFTGTFTSGWTFASTGVTPNGTSAFFNTGFNPNGILTSTNCHFSFYQSNATLTTPDKLHGIVSTTQFYQDFWGNTVGTSAIGTTSSGSNLITSNNSMFILTAPSSTAKIFRATTQIATFTSTGAMPNINFYFGAANESGTANYFTNAGISFASLGDGLTDTNATDFYNAVQTMNTTLSRQV